MYDLRRRAATAAGAGAPGHFRSGESSSGPRVTIRPLGALGAVMRTPELLTLSDLPVSGASGVLTCAARCGDRVARVTSANGAELAIGVPGGGTGAACSPDGGASL